MNARGFTLIEVLVGAAISILAITMVLFVFLSQNRTFQSLDLGREASGYARDATLEMETALKRAGFGIDPVLAFDFSCTGAPPCHDRVDGPDDITFYSRNPSYDWVPQNASLGCNTVGGCFNAGNIWPITGAAPAQITITARATDTFTKGRIVLAVCTGGSNPVFATVTTSTGAGVANIPVAINTTGIFAGNAFQGCHSQAGSALFLIDKFHYFVTTLASGAGGAAEPWLVLDTGLDLNGNGTLPPADVNDLVPVARDVEDMQVAYQIGTAVNPPFTSTTAPDSNGNWVVADAPGVLEEPKTDAGPPLNGASSGTLHPGNIRAVRVTLVIRSRVVDTSFPADGGDPPFAAEDRNNVSGAPTQYRRYPQTFSVATRNMSAANPYLLF